MRVRYNARRKLSLFASAKRLMEEEGLTLRRAAERLQVAHSLFVKWQQQRAANNDPVGTQDGGYLRKVPLPRIPLRQSTALMSYASALGNPHTCYLQVPRIPTWSDLMRSHLGAIRSTMLPLAPRWLM